MFENKFIVRKEFILENRKNENFVVIDARGDMLKAGDFVYDRAIVLDWKEFTFLTGKDNEYVGLPFAREVLLEKFSKYGITPNKKVLIYINTCPGFGMGEDGRFKFLLNFCGIEAYILDGGISEILKIDFYKKVEDDKELNKASIDIDNKPFLSYEKSILTDKLKSICKDESVKILDVRYEEEYNGKIIFGEKFGGHIKRSKSYPYTKLYDQNGYLLNNSDIEKDILNLGVSKSDLIIVYCTTGIRASIVYEILSMLGFNVKVYDESFGRWCITEEFEV